jgi:toxin-antitoxin system PIN domain toxin
MAFLLDVNVLIALFDPAHIHHNPAHNWFAEVGQTAWATCPLTENGVIRIIGDPRYPNSPGSPAAIAASLAIFMSRSGHEFWADSISLMKSNLIDPSRLLISSQITDTYLLALARSNEGQLATFDRRLVTDAVAGGKDNLHLIV